MEYQRDTAEKLARNTGGTDFSMLQLSQTAGVSPATPFNHFGSKNAIFADLINQSLHTLRKTSKFNSSVDEVVSLFASSGLQTAIRPMRLDWLVAIVDQ